MTTKHVFGGEHTEKKLDIIEAYIEVYSKILSRTYFQIFYIDAFAGTGFRNEETYLPLFNKNEKKRILPGSAIRALNANFDFDKYFFIEKNKKYFTSLKNTCNDYPHKTTICINGEANEQIEKLCREINWKKTRAALFLDPYGMEVEFKTLKVIANTKAIDTWYLFPTNSIKRQMHKEWEATPEYKIKSIDNLFGNKEWRSAFYEEGIQGDMFKKEKKSYRRYQDIAELERFIKTRFNEIFPYVSDAIPIISKKSGHQLFSLYCCVANDSPKAKDAVKKIVEYIEKKFKQL